MGLCTCDDMNEGKGRCFQKERTTTFLMAAKSWSLMDVHRLQTFWNSPSTFLDSSDSFKKTFRAPLGNMKAPFVFPLKWNESLVLLHFTDLLLTCNKITNIHVKMEAWLGVYFGHGRDYSYFSDSHGITLISLMSLTLMGTSFRASWGRHTESIHNMRLSGQMSCCSGEFKFPCQNIAFKTWDKVTFADGNQITNCLQMYENISES